MITILEDTRQQEKKHENKHKYFREHGILWRRVGLDCGDYTLPNDRSVVIDTKKDIEEFIGDIQVKQMSKGAIRQEIIAIQRGCWIPTDIANSIFNLITGDDDGRFPEGEISQFCWNNRIEGTIYKCCVMQKNGAANKCVGTVYLDEKPNDGVKTEMLMKYQGSHKVTVKTTTAEKEFQNLYVQRYGFLHRDIKRAVNNGTKFILLIESNRKINSVDDLEQHFVNKRQWLYEQRIRKDWDIPRNADFSKAVEDLKAQGANIPIGPMNGDKVAKIMRTMEDKYGVEFQFCRKSESGKRILELLGVDVSVV